MNVMEQATKQLAKMVWEQQENIKNFAVFELAVAIIVQFEMWDGCTEDQKTRCRLARDLLATVMEDLMPGRVAVNQEKIISDYQQYRKDKGL